jgi:CHAT domain
LTESDATGQEALGWDELAPLHAVLADADPRVRAAAAEAAARLPLTGSAWMRLVDVLTKLLEANPSSVVARAAAHAPLVSVRRQLRRIAADGGHPGRHVASVALADVGDDSVLATEVSRLLARPITDRTALRLAGLPLERLGSVPSIPRAQPAIQSWSTAVAAARVGDTRRLDDWLSSVLDVVATVPSAIRSALPAVLPLPDHLLAHVRARLVAGVPVHDAVRAAWLTPVPLPRTPVRLDPFADSVSRFVAGIRLGWAADPAAALAHDAAAMPGGMAPDPRTVYEGWRQVADAAAPARQAVAWTLGRAGPAMLLERLSHRLSDPESAQAACDAIAEAAAWLSVSEPPTDSAAPPAWPRPTELLDDGEADPWAKDGVSFDVGFTPEGIDVPAAEPARPAAPPSPSPAPSLAPPSRGAVPPMRGIEPAPDAGESPAAVSTTPRAPAYARLACPSAVVVEEDFDLELGLAPRPTRGVTAQPLTLPDLPSYTLTVQLVVDGFTLRQGEEPTFDLDVTTQEPYPTRTLHLSAMADPELGPLRSILAVFSVDGHTVGSATRAVEVVASRTQLPASAVDAPPTGVDTALPADAQTADLTITISKGDDLDGRRLLWSFQSPHPSVPGSAEPLSSTLGSRPEDFAKGLTKAAGRVQGELLKAEITGAGKLIAHVVPVAIHQAIRASAVAVGGPPSILLLSADPHVPWELARINPPWLPDAPPMLGAQAVVGRWALLEPGPTPEPPRSVSVRDMTIVRGVYEKVIGFNRLKHAEQEALDLEAAYGATLVDAAQEPFFACLRGEPAAQVLHFAMHGKFDPTGLQDGLILVDGNVVDPLMILGADLDQHPFVFLNACQVGMAGETLGQYGGIAQSFVEAGASAVIAPLWVVNDEVARDVSLRFYSSAFSGTAPAEFLRAERARDGSGTHLAYVLYGHPRLQLTRSKEANGDGDPAGP